MSHLGSSGVHVLFSLLFELEVFGQPRNGPDRPESMTESVILRRELGQVVKMIL